MKIIKYKVLFILILLSISSCAQNNDSLIKEYSAKGFNMIMEFNRTKDTSLLNNAILVLDSALAIDSLHYYTLYNKLMAYNLLGDFKNALACCDKILSIKPNHYYYLENKAGLLYELGYKVESEDLLKSIDSAYLQRINTHPTDTNNFINYIFMGQKRFGVLERNRRAAFLIQKFPMHREYIEHYLEEDTKLPD